MAKKCKGVGGGRYLFGFGSCRSRNGDNVDVAVIPAFLDQTEMPLKCNNLLALRSSHNKFHQTFYKWLNTMPFRRDDITQLCVHSTYVSYSHTLGD